METAPETGRRMTMIYHGDRHEMVMIDHEKKQYFVLDEATMKEMAAKMGEAMSKMEPAMAKMPKAQREAMKKMMEGRGMGGGGGPANTEASPTELHKTGKSRTIAGYPCAGYQVRSNGRVLRELWVTDFDHIGGSKQAEAAMKEMAAFVREMTTSFKNMSRGLGGRMDTSAFEYMDQLAGYPVVTKEFGKDGSLKTESELKSSRRENLDADQFEPPAGYKQQKMFGGR